MQARATCRRPSASATRPNVTHGDVDAALAGGRDADRGDLRDAGAISQRDGAARDRRRLGWRQAVDRYADARVGHDPRAHRRTCSALRRTRSTSAVRFSAAALAQRDLQRARRCSASWRRGWSAGRSSSCCAVTRCMARSAIARRPARPCALAPIATADSPRSPITQRSRRAPIDDFYEPAANASRRALCQPCDCGLARGRAHRYRHAAVHARARRSTGLDRAGERHRRGGVGLPHGPARVPPEELCRGRADHRQAVLLQGAARMLRAGRRTLRLVEAAAGAAPDARQGRPAGRLGRRHRDLSGADVPWPRRAP